MPDHWKRVPTWQNISFFSFLFINHSENNSQWRCNTDSFLMAMCTTAIMKDASAKVGKSQVYRRWAAVSQVYGWMQGFSGSSRRYQVFHVSGPARFTNTDDLRAVPAQAISFWYRKIFHPRVHSLLTFGEGSRILQPEKFTYVMYFTCIFHVGRRKKKSWFKSIMDLFQVGCPVLSKSDW